MYVEQDSRIKNRDEDMVINRGTTIKVSILVELKKTNEPN